MQAGLRLCCSQNPRRQVFLRQGQFSLSPIPTFTTIAVCSLICLRTLVASIANIMDRDQTAPLGAV